MGANAVTWPPDPARSHDVAPGRSGRALGRAEQGQRRRAAPALTRRLSHT